jgi:hypothetical protein
MFLGFQAGIFIRGSQADGEQRPMIKVNKELVIKGIRTGPCKSQRLKFKLEKKNTIV